MAREKATESQRGEKFTDKNTAILTGDTVIACGRRILDKPADEAQAHANILKLLSGRAHRCYCAVCLIDNDGKIRQRISLTRIVFKNLSADEITQYISSEEWQGKAGGYHIYGMAQKFIIKLNGSASAVAGLPLFETAQLLRGQ